MAKFRKGDKVIAQVDSYPVQKGDYGIVAENNSSEPWVKWKNSGQKHSIDEDYLELDSTGNTNYSIY